MAFLFLITRHKRKRLFRFFRLRFFIRVIPRCAIFFMCGDVPYSDWRLLNTCGMMHFEVAAVFCLINIPTIFIVMCFSY